MFGKFIRNLYISWKSPKWRMALLLAVVSDILGSAFTFAPPVHWTIDIVTIALLFVVLGFKWPLLPALVVEVIPGLQIFPFWTLFVTAMAGSENERGNKGLKPDNPGGSPRPGGKG